MGKRIIRGIIAFAAAAAAAAAMIFSVCAVGCDDECSEACKEDSTCRTAYVRTVIPIGLKI
ncbi:hypothetical protein [uncultured Ruminococcus sp.]|uniref:hypothetical protein n=1 Tax=uncultured Ruminococcus sp. TaxID=165186 RepID=UPI0025FE938E|nr:hypothetical protein [uncultured Ruminococcus sp.]